MGLNMLRVVVEQRFFKCSHGMYWTENSFPYSFWCRYLIEFQHVEVVARVLNVEQSQDSWNRVDGPNVTLKALPMYIGPIEFLLTFPKVIFELLKLRNGDCYTILRAPGILSSLYQRLVCKKDYGLEVVGDPFDVFDGRASHSKVKLLFRSIFVTELTRLCQEAKCTAYVTKYSLQKRYPPKIGCFTTDYSSIHMDEVDYKERNYLTNPLDSNCFKLIAIGNLSQPYKGCDYILKVIKSLKEQGHKTNLIWVGGGSLMESMHELAKDYGVSENVEFVGNVSSKEAVLDYIDNADIFVLGSRQEGLPRVLIESMARSLICIATRVGGVPELLPEEFIVDVDDVKSLTDTIIKIKLLNEVELNDIANSNYIISLNYKNSILTEKRRDFYKSLKG